MTSLVDHRAQAVFTVSEGISCVTLSTIKLLVLRHKVPEGGGQVRSGEPVFPDHPARQTRQACVSRAVGDLVQRLALQQAEEGPLVMVDQVKVRPMVQQGLNHCRLGWLVECCSVQRCISLRVSRVGVGPAFEE